MELIVKDANFQAVGLLDQFESLIWTDRFSAYGDFEFYVKSLDYPDVLKTDYYLFLKESEHVMIVEDRSNDSDVEKGSYIKVTGRSLESILDRRVIWQQTILSGNLQNGIHQLLNDAIISPTDTTRKIPNFIFEASTDPLITNLTVNTQFTGDNLYTAIKQLCDNASIGFKITINSANQFVFKLYAGTDRSYQQTTNPFVVFSPRFDNLITSNYVDSIKTLKTISLVGGEGEGSARKLLGVSISSGAGSGLSRREMFTDARDVSSTVSGSTLTTEQYNAQLTQRGQQDLAKNTATLSFEGTTDATNMYKYGTDFGMGDIIQVENEYGMRSRSRVTEMVNSQSTEGLSFLPTFTAI